MRVEWQRIAENDLAELVAYIAQDNPAAAYALHDEIVTQVGQLADQPRLGRAGRVRGTRELVIARTTYIVAYRIAAKTVRIIRVLHGSQQWPEQM